MWFSALNAIRTTWWLIWATLEIGIQVICVRPDPCLCPEPPPWFLSLACLVSTQFYLSVLLKKNHHQQKTLRAKEKSKTLYTKWDVQLSQPTSAGKHKNSLRIENVNWCKVWKVQVFLSFKWAVRSKNTDQINMSCLKELPKYKEMLTHNPQN